MVLLSGDALKYKFRPKSKAGINRYSQSYTSCILVILSIEEERYRYKSQDYANHNNK